MASWARTTLSVAAWVPLGVAFNDLVASIHPVEGKSMEPTLNAGGSTEWILLNRLASPQRGDPVVVADPGRFGELITKRIIGVAGDWVTFPQRSGDGTSSGKRASVYLYPGTMWLEGDNQASSRDSLEFGPVPMALFRGRVSAVVWPPHRARLVDRQYQTHRIAQPFGATEFSDSHEARAAAAGRAAGDRPEAPPSAAAEP